MLENLLVYVVSSLDILYKVVFSFYFFDYFFPVLFLDKYYSLEVADLLSEFKRRQLPQWFVILFILNVRLLRVVVNMPQVEAVRLVCRTLEDSLLVSAVKSEHMLDHILYQVTTAQFTFDIIIGFASDVYSHLREQMRLAVFIRGQ